MCTDWHFGVGGRGVFDQWATFLAEDTDTARTMNEGRAAGIFVVSLAFDRAGCHGKVPRSKVQGRFSVPWPAERREADPPSY